MKKQKNNFIYFFLTFFLINCSSNKADKIILKKYISNNIAVAIEIKNDDKNKIMQCLSQIKPISQKDIKIEFMKSNSGKTITYLLEIYQGTKIKKYEIINTENIIYNDKYYKSKCMFNILYDYLKL